MKTLIIMRHAKAAPGAVDIERGLTMRGRKQAQEMGGMLGKVDLGIVSAANRAQQTFVGATSGGLVAEDVRFDESLYWGGVAESLEALHQAHGDRVLYVGHEPTVSELTAFLAPARFYGFSTAAAAILEFPGEWTDLAAGVAKVQQMLRASV